MREATRKIGVALLAAVSIGAATIATSAPAEARWHGGHGGWHGGGWHRGGGWVGPAIVGGLALGAIAAARPYGYGYGYGYPAYGYDGCLRRRVVGYTPYGRPIVRAVNVCY